MRTVIPGPQVTLRQFAPDDVDAVFEAAYQSRHAIARYLPWCHANYRREETEEYLAGRPAAWETGEEFSFAIIDSADGRLLGGCGINQLNRIHLLANLGYWVRTDVAGRGIATAAARALAEAALEDLGLERIEIWAAVDNAASRRVAEKCGARFEVIAARRLRTHGRQQDAAGYVLLRDDFSLPPLSTTE